METVTVSPKFQVVIPKILQVEISAPISRSTRIQSFYMKNSAVCFVLVALLLVMTACTPTRDSSLLPSETPLPTLAADSGETIAFPRQKKTEGERAVMEGEITGTLVLTDNCIRLDHDKSDTSYLLIWPPDFNFTIENEKIKILSDDSTIVASLGDKVYMGGGEIQLLTMIDEFVQEQVPPQCNGPYWIVGEGFKTLDSSK